MKHYKLTFRCKCEHEDCGHAFEKTVDQDPGGGLIPAQVECPKCGRLVRLGPHIEKQQVAR